MDTYKYLLSQIQHLNLARKRPSSSSIIFAGQHFTSKHCTWTQAGRASMQSLYIKLDFYKPGTKTENPQSPMRALWILSREMLKEENGDKI